jgi:hypothetical protein
VPPGPLSPTSASPKTQRIGSPSLRGSSPPGLASDPPTAQHAAVAHAAPLDLRGSAFGLLATVQSFGNLAASTIASILWTSLSPTWAFGFLAVAMIAATTFIALR